MNNSNIESICKNIDENPDDRFLLSVLADALEEVGDDRARGIRWLIEKEKMPEDNCNYSSTYNWIWWSPFRDYEESTYELIWDMFWKLEKIEGDDLTYGRNYHTLSSAYLAAADAYCKTYLPMIPVSGVVKGNSNVLK